MPCLQGTAILKPLSGYRRRIRLCYSSDSFSSVLFLLVARIWQDYMLDDYISRGGPVIDLKSDWDEVSRMKRYLKFEDNCLRGSKLGFGY